MIISVQESRKIAELLPSVTKYECFGSIGEGRVTISMLDSWADGGRVWDGV